MEGQKVDRAAVVLPTENAPRRDEVGRLAKIIGWSWPMVYEQLGWTLSQGISFKSGKRSIEDFELRWLALIAQLHIDNPRPNAPAAAASVSAPQARQEMATMGENVGQVTPGEVTRAVLAETIALAYRDAAGNGDLSEAQLAAARWAIGDLAERLQVKGLVVEILKREVMPASVAAAPWQVPPPPAGAIGAAVSREPF